MRRASASPSAAPTASSSSCERRVNAPDVDAEVAAAVEALRPELARLVRELYDEPEIGFAEHASVARIAAVLGAHGVDVEVGAFGLETAFRVSVGGARGDAAGSGSGSGSAEREASTPHFAILAEYDALPGIGHACGHNIIAGVAVGAFLGAAPVVARLGGRLSLLGTPAEENGGGKELIIRAGGFDDVDAAGMVHPGPGSGTGSVLGQRTTGVRRIAVIYHGRAAHAAGRRGSAGTRSTGSSRRIRGSPSCASTSCRATASTASSPTEGRRPTSCPSGPRRCSTCAPPTSTACAS